MARIREKELQKAILDYLRLKKIFCWRNNTGAFVRDNHFYRFGDSGSPDIFAVIPKFEEHINKTDRQAFCGDNCVFGQIYGIEVKGNKGKQSENQKMWQLEFERNGGKYILARSIDDILGHL